MSGTDAHRRHKAMLERDFYMNVVREDLRKLKGVWFVKTATHTRSGLPDMIVCLQGRFIAMELKRAADAITTDMQIRTLKEISEKGGGVGIIVWPEVWPDVYKILQRIDQTKELTEYDKVDLLSATRKLFFSSDQKAV